MGMKMAKASDDDMRAAEELVSIVNSISSGMLPAGATPAIDNFDPDRLDHLKALYERLIELDRRAPGGLSRVVWGFRTIVGNDVLDPDSDVLLLHPRITAALGAKDDTRATAESGADGAPSMAQST